MKTNVQESSLVAYYEDLVAEGKLQRQQAQVLRIMVDLGGGWMSRRQISEASKRVTGKNMENGTVSARINALEAAGLVEVDSKLTDCPSSGNGVHKVRLTAAAVEKVA